MKRFLFVAMAVLGLQTVACGGPMEAEDALQPQEGSEVTAMAVCTASCPGGTSVSCSGNHCEAVEGQAVMCDGQWKDCPSPTTVSFFCESTNSAVSCTGFNAYTLQPLNSKVCGGVSCNGVDTYCPAFTDARECF
ncbi:hypothetical protein HI113_35600 [Corallococcus exiguus]|uniref:hypothetical protein n=1 Tax=Corallococcus exiguus TaxID=83462 RepID=UPI00147504C2|nr:hypothetical protein [Corallococcus exiguus]NNB99230.1 hypothetical protein [Corallococcus exiguus]